jgi:Uma2 family endonuclease
MEAGMTALPNVSTEAPAVERKPETPLKMTFDEFLAWAGEDTHAEWVNGEVKYLMTVDILHQRIVEFLSRLIGLFVESFDMGDLFTGPAGVRLERSLREPDLFFVSKARKAQIEEKYFSGAPDLIIEVISDESVSRDRAEKFEEYEDSGVREYWIIDPRPRRRRADFYVLGPDGKYQPVPLDVEGIYRSTVLPGFWLKADWLWADPLPKLLPTLKEITG